MRSTGARSVMTMVSSRCADRLPSVVRSVQPSSAVREPARSGGDAGLDGQNQPGSEQLAGSGIVDVWDAGRFVDGTSNAMAAELANHGESATAHFALSCRAESRRYNCTLCKEKEPRGRGTGMTT